MNNSVPKKTFDFIIHAGTHKTGSTAIQHALATAPDLGAFTYLDWGNTHLDVRSPPHNAAFAIAFPTGPQPPEPEAQSALRTQLLHAIEAAEGRGIILSAERISVTHQEPLAAFMEIIRPYVRSLRVIVYVRDPIGFATSAIGQSIRQGTQIDLIKPFQYKAYFQRLEAVFGSEAMTYRLFDRAHLHGGDVVLDFAHLCGIDLAVPPSRMANDALSLEGMAVGYAMRHPDVAALGHKDERIAFAQTMREISSIGTQRLTLGPTITEEIKTRSASGWAWMSERAGFPSDAKGATGAEATVDALEDFLPIAAKTRTALKARQETLFETSLAVFSKDLGAQVNAADALEDDLAAVRALGLVIYAAATNRVKAAQSQSEKFDHV